MRPTMTLLFAPISEQAIKQALVVARRQAGGRV